MDALNATRDGVDKGTLRSLSAHDVYTRTIETLLALFTVPEVGPEYADLARERDGYVALARTKELGSELRSRIFAIGRAARFSPGDFIEIADLRTQRQNALIAFRTSASPADTRRIPGNPFQSVRCSWHALCVDPADPEVGPRLELNIR